MDRPFEVTGVPFAWVAHVQDDAAFAARQRLTQRFGRDRPCPEDELGATRERVDPAVEVALHVIDADAAEPHHRLALTAG